MDAEGGRWVGRVAVPVLRAVRIVRSVQAFPEGATLTATVACMKS